MVGFELIKVMSWGSNLTMTPPLFFFLSWVDMIFHGRGMLLGFIEYNMSVGLFSEINNIAVMK